MSEDGEVIRVQDEVSQEESDGMILSGRRYELVSIKGKVMYFLQ